MKPVVFQLWGKADPRRASAGPAWHPLVYHATDVAACARVLLEDVNPARLSALAEALGLSPAHACSWILFVVALHDLGKATPAFQAKVQDRRSALEALGLDFPDGREPHGAMSSILVAPQLERFGCPPRLARGLAAAVAAHHGAFATSEHVVEIEESGGRNAGRQRLWEELRRMLADGLAELFDVRASPPPSLPVSEAAYNSVIADLAGLTAVADWLGSNADVFSYVEPQESLEAYEERSRLLARRAVTSAGFRRSPHPPARSFTALFSKAPWPLHERVEALLGKIDRGSVVIIEAPMGEGKTEAAMLIYDSLAARGVDGLYFALPTQATANQIFGRVQRYLETAFAGETHGLHLVHGAAGLSEQYDRLKDRAFATASVGDVSYGAEDQGPVADAWFARPKRALLAPVAIGTVDQALLGVLRSKHHFVRLHGLARKVVIVDEVHAYDTFTSEILARLCSWLRALGSIVVLLSATLASPQRRRLLEAFGVEGAAAAAAYPRITIAHDGRVRTESFSARRPSRTVRIEWKPERDLFHRTAETLCSSGGCVAWIVNTVSRAQATYLELRAMLDRGELPPDTRLYLLHARFPFAARQLREQRVEAAFGPPGKAEERPRCAVVVGTQVLEQSLDLDFDLMITDVAPVDLVFQRAGRLHRHDRARPAELAAPQLWISSPAELEAEIGPRFGTSRLVYDEAVLLRSWLALKDRAHVVLPTDIEPLVEAVYTATCEAPPAIASRLRELDARRDSEARSAAADAGRRELPAPDEAAPFSDFAVRFDEEDPAIHQDLKAVTRLGAPSISVVPFVERDGYTLLAAEPGTRIDLRCEALAPEEVRAIARQAIPTADRRVVAALLDQPPPRCFQRSGHLRHHRVLRLGEDGCGWVGDTQIRLDPDLGLVIGDLHDAAGAS